MEGEALGDGFAAHGGGSSNVKWMEMANNGRGGYGGSNVMLMRTESSTDTLVAMLASCSPVALQGAYTGACCVRVRLLSPAAWEAKSLLLLS